MGERVAFLEDGKPLARITYFVKEGAWFDDNWITPRLLIDCKGFGNARVVTLRGCGSDFSVRLLDNTLTLQVGDQQETCSIPWGALFEICVPLPAVTPPILSLLIRVNRFLEPDALDNRERAVVLTDIIFSDCRSMGLAYEATARAAGLSQGDFETILLSGVFNQDFYLKTYPDVAKAGVNPLLHYLEYGRFEKRKASETFDPVAYLEANPEVANSGIEPFLHYVLIGRAAGAPCCATSRGIIAPGDRR